MDINNESLEVARHSAEAESKCYQHYISDKVTVTSCDKNEHLTYQLISKSAISIGCVSTALYEDAIRGSRVLFFLHRHLIWNFRC